MIRDYQMVSPSLGGVLSHDVLSYEGVERPSELLRVLDGPSSKGIGIENRHKGKICSEEEMKMLNDYFHDLYGVFMKKLSYFIVASESTAEETVKLQAMLQEMIKVKRLTMNNR